jgi:hypothetical protein
MSKQGTTESGGWAESILDDWGSWVRADSLGLGYSSLKVRPKGDNLIYTEEDLLRADRAIARLTYWQKKTIKDYFRWLIHDPIPESRINAALEAFEESWKTLEENN